MVSACGKQSKKEDLCTWYDLVRLQSQAQNIVISTTYICGQQATFKNAIVKKTSFSLFLGDKNAVDCHDLPGFWAFPDFNSSPKVTTFYSIFSHPTPDS